ncbi:MAG: PAC2 family protein [Rubrobacter sp.]|nr:PAC2 family protein [Rubrobacter sp.]
MDNRYMNLDRKPQLERPIMVIAFTGWNDAAEASSLALKTMGEAWEAESFGSFDSEEFFDFQVTRPQIQLVEGVTRDIQWPENVLRATESAPEATGGRGVVLVSGPEPNLRWKTFSNAVVELAREMNVELIVTLGALLADVPHSRPVSVAANSQDPELVEGLDLTPSRYEGPTGLTGALHRICADSGIPSVSFWASTPHYLPAVPSAPAAIALLERFRDLTGISVDTSDLDRNAGDYQEQISAAVSRDSDLASYVQMLEERYDSQAEGARDLPSGDDLAQELEDFLRDQRDDE